MTPPLEHSKIIFDIIYKMYAWASAFTTPRLKALSLGSALYVKEGKRVFSNACFW